MFIGHFALGFASKRLVPAVSLGTLFLACQLADLVWPTMLFLGIERVEIRPGITVATPLDFISYPFSHSLMALLLWSFILAGSYKLLWRSRSKSLVVIAALVVSHWFLDFLMHRPDLPLTLDGSGRYGMGLWNSLPITLAVELLTFIAGIWLYTASTRAISRKGSTGLSLFITLLLVIFLLSIFGPPPPSSRAVAWAAQCMWLFVVWGYWIDRHRQSNPS